MASQAVEVDPGATYFEFRGTNQEGPSFGTRTGNKFAMDSARENFEQRTGLNLAELLSTTALSRPQIDFVSRRHYLVKRPEVIRRAIQTPPEPFSKISKKESFLRLARFSRSGIRTIRRAIAAKEPISGVVLLGICSACKVPFAELADFDDPVPHAKPGRKGRNERLRAVLTERRLRVLYVPMPPVWDFDPKDGGIASQWMTTAAGLHGVSIDPQPCDDFYAIPVLLGGMSGDVLVTSPENHPLRHELRYVATLVKYKIGIMGKGAPSTSEAVELINSSMKAPIAVIPHGYSLFEISNWGVNSEYLRSGAFTSYEQMGEYILDGEASFAVAYHHGLTQALQSRPLAKLLSVPNQPVTICHYSVWVRRDDEALALWLRTALRDAERKMHRQMAAFRRAYAPSLDVAYH